MSQVPPFDPNIHLCCPAQSPSHQELVKDFKAALCNDQHQGSQSPSLADLYRKHIDWADDMQLYRFLIARNFNLQASIDLIRGALEWRERRQPSKIDQEEFWHVKLSKESETGKIYCPGKDKWGRSVLIFDNTVQNTPHVDDHMTFLAWNLEFAIKQMAHNVNQLEIAGSTSSGLVDKYLVFMHLKNFSFFNVPPMNSTRETIHMLCNCFPERLGHCIAYQPPYIFKAFFDSVSIFLDPKTVSKVKFIYGDVSDGSENDRLLRDLIGNDWKQLTGAEQPVLQPNSSPGYNHNIYWPSVLKRQAALGNKFVPEEFINVSNDDKKTNEPESSDESPLVKPDDS